MLDMGIIYVITQPKVVRGPVTKISQSDYSIAVSIFSKFWTRYSNERSCMQFMHRSGSQ